MRASRGACELSLRPAKPTTNANPKGQGFEILGHRWRGRAGLPKFTTGWASGEGKLYKLSLVLGGVGGVGGVLSKRGPKKQYALY
jgi:hypothetical protein